MTGSQNRHALDQLVRDVAQGRRTATPQEIEQLREHVATAPFNTQSVRARADVRGLVYQGRQVQRHDDSVFVHLVQRAVADRQWTVDTTTEDFVRDLQRAAGDRSANIAIYDDGRGPIAGFFTMNPVPVSRHGRDAEPFIYVVYAADRRSIITGYQVKSLDEVRIPESAQWLT